MLATFLICFGASGVACAGALLASYAAENGLPFGLPTIALPQRFAASAGPVWCESARRWRDPVTLRFVKAPAR